MGDLADHAMLIAFGFSLTDSVYDVTGFNGHCARFWFGVNQCPTALSTLCNNLTSFFFRCNALSRCIVESEFHSQSMRDW
jgi:hypothetical protein